MKSSRLDVSRFVLIISFTVCVLATCFMETNGSHSDPGYNKGRVSWATQEVLRMQDAMHPASETFESTNNVAQWLVENQLPWLEGLDFAELARLLRLFCVNSHPCKSAGKTSGLLKWGTMINHSCLPNVAGPATLNLGFKNYIDKTIYKTILVGLCWLSYIWKLFHYADHRSLVNCTVPVCLDLLGA